MTLYDLEQKLKNLRETQLADDNSEVVIDHAYADNFDGSKPVSTVQLENPCGRREIVLG